jgi:two-component system, chemotaxis family, chemotaxis protein CheY
MTEDSNNSSDANAPTPPQEKDTIVIAEDSAPNRKILSHLLEKLGFHVVACENGQVAWEEVQSGKHPRIIAVISDIMMPAVDGIELLKKIRAEEKFKTLPFVLVTAVSDKEYIAQAKSLNVNGYILKPVTFQRVTSKLQELFPTRKLPKIAA